MTDSLPSDHDAVESHRVHLTEVGRTGRPQITLPDDVSCREDDLIWLSLDGTAAYAQVTTALTGERVIQGAFPNQRLARDHEGENKLAAWVTDGAVDFGDALLLDVLTEGYAYGIRNPGERVVYSPPDSPDSSLSDIAQNLDE